LERAGLPSGYDGSQQFFEDFFVHEFWRNVVAQKQILELAETAIDFPPMQKGASFNLDSVVEKLKAHPAGQ
jgi:arylsulfatase